MKLINEEKITTKYIIEITPSELHSILRIMNTAKEFLEEEENIYLALRKLTK